MGKMYRLKIVENHGESLVLETGYFRLRVTRISPMFSCPEEELKDFHQQKGFERITEHVGHFEARIDVSTGT